MSEITLHNLIAKEFPKRKRPWDIKLFPPIGTEDLAVYTIYVKWNKGDKWEIYNYKIELTLISVEYPNVNKS